MTHTTKHNIRTIPRGFVLVTVLALLVLLAVVVLEFFHQGQMGLTAADNHLAQVKAQACARGGLQMALAVLRDRPEVLTDPKMNTWLYRQHPLGEGSFSLTLVDEGGKINVNQLKDPNGRLDTPRIDQFLRLIDQFNRRRGDREPLSYAVAAAIIDWTDADDQVTLLPMVQGDNQGAESNYYRQLPVAYDCANHPAVTVSELQWVKGLSCEVLYGPPPTAVQTSLTSAPSPATSGALADCLTVYGDGKININTASEMVLAGLTEDMTPALAHLIVQRRQQKPFEDILQVQDVPGMSATVFKHLAGQIAVRSSPAVYTIIVTGSVPPASWEVLAVVSQPQHGGEWKLHFYREQIHG